MAGMTDVTVKKIGVRVDSRYHEVDEDTSEAFCYFAAMVDLMSEKDAGEIVGADGERFTANDAAELTGFVRDMLEAGDESISIYTEGELYCGDGRVEVRYREPNELTGMGESVTSISFDESNRDIITITRGGDVCTALVLECGVRHTCAYNTDALPFIIYTTAKRIKNGLSESGGILDMIYTVEAQHGTAQFNRVTVTVTLEEERKCP